jgi:hypothetical protein
VLAPTSRGSTGNFRDKLVNAVEANPTALWAPDYSGTATAAGTRLTPQRLRDLTVDRNAPFDLFAASVTTNDHSYKSMHLQLLLLLDHYSNAFRLVEH